MRGPIEQQSDGKKSIGGIELAARKLAEDEHNGVHTACVGEDENGEPCIICKVPKKLTTSELNAQKIEPIPRYVKLEDNPSEVFKVKVEEVPIYKPLLLKVNYDNPFSLIAHSSARGLQDCQSPIIKGGSQIAPQGAQWVGTLGCAARIKEDDGSYVYGCITNHHVANGDQFGQDAPQCQPHGRGPVFGSQYTWMNLNYNQGENYCDFSFIQDKRSKDTGNREVYCIPEQHGPNGRLNPDYLPAAQIQVGMEMDKPGRTTGYTKLRVTQTSATSHVGYGQNKVAKFVGQSVLQGIDGQGSAAGDSGSIIRYKGRPALHLFAGGGNDTIAYPIEYAITRVKGLEFWQR